MMVSAERRVDALADTPMTWNNSASLPDILRTYVSDQQLEVRGRAGHPFGQGYRSRSLAGRCVLIVEPGSLQRTRLPQFELVYLAVSLSWPNAAAS